MDKGIVLDAALALAHTQILAQNADEASLDGQTMGLVAFNGALLAANIAAKDVIGRFWWVPLPAIAVATGVCLALGFGLRGDLGPKAATFYEHFGGQLAIPAREQLLADLNLAFDRNAARVREKYIGVRGALGILLVGLTVAALLIAFASPSRIKACRVESPAQLAKHLCSSPNLRDFRMSGRAASSSSSSGCAPCSRAA